MVRLKVYRDADKVEEVVVEDELLTIGRDPSSGLVLSDHSVSRHHAQIEPRGNFHLIRDNNSTNGTFVNEMLVRLQVLTPGDTIRVGKYLLAVDEDHARSGDTTRVRVERLSFPGQSRDEDIDGLCPDEEPDHSFDALLRLQETQRKLGHLDTTQGLLDRALDILLTELKADRGSILLPPSPTTTPTPGELEPAVVLTRPREDSDGDGEEGTPGDPDELVIPQELLEEAVAFGDSVDFSLPKTSGDGGVACLACPLADQDRFLGVLYIERRGRDQGFRAEDGKLLAAIAGQISTGLVNAQLYAEFQGSQGQIQAIFSSLSDGVLVTDNAFKIIEANAAATVLLEFSKNNLLGESLHDLLAQHEVRPKMDLLLSTESCVERSVFEVKVMNADSRSVQRVLGGSIVRYPRQNVAETRGYVITLRDRSQAWRLEQIKSEFIEKVAHKLRTPLTVLRANLPILRNCIRESGSAETLEVLKEIDRSSNALCGLVDRFVDFTEMGDTSIEEGLPSQPIQLRSVLRDLVRDHEEAWKAKNISIIDRIASDISRVDAHVAQLSKALSHIIDNAIKFCDQDGSITVEARDENGLIRVDISNTGPSIDPQEIESVFYVGHQIDSEQTGQVPGVGLGLTISRHVIKSYGGEIRLTSPSRPGSSGTTVTVLLPQSSITTPVATESSQVKSPVAAIED